MRIKNNSKRDTRNVLYTHQRHEGSYLNDDLKIALMTGWCDAWLPNTRLYSKLLSPSTNLISLKWDSPRSNRRNHAEFRGRGTLPPCHLWWPHMSILLLIIFREAAQEIFAVWHWVSLHTHTSITQIMKQKSRLQKSRFPVLRYPFFTWPRHKSRKEKLKRFHLTA